MPEAKEPVILSPEKIPQHADDTDVLVDKIIGMVKGYSPNANTDMIYVAYKLAKSAHSHQFRRSGAPYIEHPVQLAYIAAQLSLDATAISAALLHDVVEDTPYTYENIETIFGKSVAELVDGVTKLRKIKYNTREEQQVENLRKMFLAMAKDIRVVIIKLIDRLHNMRTLNFMPRAKQLLISKETLDVYAPLAHRLGMSKIKIELEDLALKYLDPVAYEEIRQSINQKKDEREKYIRDIMDVLREKLDQMNIKSQVTVFSEKCTRRTRQLTNFTTFSQSELLLIPLRTVTRYSVWYTIYTLPFLCVSRTISQCLNRICINHFIQRL